jgi:gamma-glutamyltranspeptidase/glutathione hydrolase
MLQILEHFDVGGYAIDDPEYIHLMAQVLYLGNADEYVPDWQQVSKALAARRVREIDMNTALPIPVRPGGSLDGETNHLSVVDADGNAVAITQSIGPTFGSKAASSELGFFYAYSYDMNDEPIPYQREKTSQSPTMVLRENMPFIVVGSAGSSRIPGSIVRAIVNVIDHGMTLGDALAARRWFIYENELRIEASGLPESTLGSLRDYGYTLRSYDGLDSYFASVHAVMIDRPAGAIYGAADPRDYGAAGGR